MINDPFDTIDPLLAHTCDPMRADYPDRHCHACWHPVTDFDQTPKKNFVRERPVDMVNHPPHYNNHPSGIECIEINRWMTYDPGNAFKYVFRTEHKNGREDLEKARFYLTDAVRHAVRVFQPMPPARYERVITALHLVIAAETDPNRIRFFESVRYGALRTALEAVRAMLE